jgi:hypothetical protein
MMAHDPAVRSVRIAVTRWILLALIPHVLVGTIYGEPTIVDQKYIRDLARTPAIVGFSESTGEVLWRDPGSTLHCPDGKVPHPVRCRRRGISTYQTDAGSSFEGLDVLTGKTTWSVPMGAVEAMVGASTRPAIAGPSADVN